MTISATLTYQKERSAYRQVLLQDRGLLIRARFGLAIYVLWWLVIFPWAIVVPSILFWAALRRDDPVLANAILIAAWKVVPKGTIMILALAATITAILCQPYRSILAERLDQHMHDWSLINFPPRKREKQQ